MTATNVNVSGQVKFFDHDKGFGIVITRDGDVFLHVSKVGALKDQLVKDAQVHIDYTTTYKEGVYKRAATALLSVKTPSAPPEPVEILDTVLWFNRDKGLGFINCPDANLSKPTAFLHVSVCNKAGVTPGKGMPVRALVIESQKGPKVLSFQWGEAVEAAWSAKLAEMYAEDCDVEPSTDPFAAMFDGHREETMQAIGQSSGVATPAEPKPVKKARAKKADAKPKGKVTRKSGGIPSAKEYGIHPEDIASMAERQCAKGGGLLAQAMLAATASN